MHQVTEFFTYRKHMMPTIKKFFWVSWVVELSICGVIAFSLYKQNASSYIDSYSICMMIFSTFSYYLLLKCHWKATLISLAGARKHMPDKFSARLWFNWYYLFANPIMIKCYSCYILSGGFGLILLLLK